jgi:hypothetical protein
MRRLCLRVAKSDSAGASCGKADLFRIINIGNIVQTRLGWIGAGRSFARNARMLILMLKIVLMLGGGIGLAGCTPALHDDELPMRFDDYCAYRATEGVHLPLCAQDEAGRMLALYAFRYGCHYADPASFTDCLYLEAEVDRLILRDID